MTHGRLPPAVYTDSRAASTLPPTALHLLPLSAEGTWELRRLKRLPGSIRRPGGRVTGSAPSAVPTTSRAATSVTRAACPKTPMLLPSVVVHVRPMVVLVRRAASPAAAAPAVPTVAPTAAAAAASAVAAAVVRKFVPATGIAAAPRTTSPAAASASSAASASPDAASGLVLLRSCQGTFTKWRSAPNGAAPHTMRQPGWVAHPTACGGAARCWQCFGQLSGPAGSINRGT
mmetsp:Transcript_8171/g.24268  ORF Transcript_8171/g.24268 Transcript_8171/m.24268 type:complete len:231 (-) Transcript_8171:1823-2515(-)